MSRSPAFVKFCQRNLAVCDGAMGTCLAQAGLSAEDFGKHPGCNEYLNLSRPDVVTAIHRRYLEAGAQVIETNSFGGARHILDEQGLGKRCQEINRAAARLARRAADEFSRPSARRFVAGSIGPGSRLPSLGQISFDQLVDSYRPQIKGLWQGGADGFIVETSQDLLQLKAALSAIADILQINSGILPAIAQVTLDRGGRTLTGSDISAVLAALEPLPVLAVGLNCGLGPEGMAEAVRYLAGRSTKLVSVMPNAGLPSMRKGQPVYTLTPEAFAAQMRRYASGPGVNIVGGCCGTTPEHIRALAGAVRGLAPRRPARRRTAALSSLYQSQDIELAVRPLIAGERTNASGSKLFRELLARDDFEGMVRAAQEQEREGAHLVDLSLAAAGRDEAKDFDALAARLNTSIRLPVMLDCTDPVALEAGLKRLAGRSVVNSINLEDGGRKAEKILGLCRRHGAAVVGMCIDERGMATTAKRKLKVAGRLAALARAYGLEACDLFIDPLTFTLASGDKNLARAGRETLAALAAIKKRHPGCHTILGVSNISYGLPAPARKCLNAVFLDEALKRGLDAAILHAGKITPLASIPPRTSALCRDLIYDRRRKGVAPLATLLDRFQRQAPGPRRLRAQPDSPEDRAGQQVIDGDAAGLYTTVEVLLQKYSAIAILDRLLLPAMDRVGRMFGQGKLQLPFVLRSAEAMQQAARLLEPHLKRSTATQRGTMVLATVRGDIHDIGKDLVDMILTANGYRVINLGVRQSAEDILSAAAKHRPDAIGLSGLLVESVRAMKEYLEVFGQAGLTVPVVCGGAALQEGFLKREMRPAYPGEVHYARDAMDGLRIMNAICRKRGARRN